MSSLEELISRAKLLLSEGHSPGQIADELSLSMETVTWLLTQAKGTSAPKDVHIDWTSVSSESPLLEGIAMLLLKRYYCAIADTDDGEPDPVDAVVGIALSGIPLATVISIEESSRLAIYHPSKQSTNEKPVGSISGNFAPVNGQRCVIVDDVITSGNTMKEVITYLRKHGAIPAAVLVIFDKKGVRDIEGVPVYSLFKISRID